MGRIPNRVRNQVVGSSGELMGFVYKIISTKQLHFVWNMYPRRLSNEHHFSKRPHMLCSVWDDFNSARSCFLLSSKRLVISCREPNNSAVWIRVHKLIDTMKYFDIGEQIIVQQTDTFVFGLFNQNVPCRIDKNVPEQGVTKKRYLMCFGWGKGWCLSRIVVKNENFVNIFATIKVLKYLEEWGIFP